MFAAQLSVQTIRENWAKHLADLVVNNALSMQVLKTFAVPACITMRLPKPVREIATSRPFTFTNMAPDCKCCRTLCGALLALNLIPGAVLKLTKLRSGAEGTANAPWELEAAFAKEDSSPRSCTVKGVSSYAENSTNKSKSRCGRAVVIACSTDRCCAFSA